MKTSHVLIKILDKASALIYNYNMQNKNSSKGF